MEPLWNFGISQEDARSELLALQLEGSDHVLSVASAGEVALNLAAMSDASIVAVDTSLPQILLCELKLASALRLEPDVAAGFLGYTSMRSEHRLSLLADLAPGLAPRTRLFWDEHRGEIAKGIIGRARFERYLGRYQELALLLLGRQHVRALLECPTVEEQRDYFDRHFRASLLRGLFKLAFHPRVYRNRGMAAQGLTHSRERDIATFFFDRFRDFCTSTPARENCYYQYSFFGHVTHATGLPEFLSPAGVARLRRRGRPLRFLHAEYGEHLSSQPVGTYNKFHLSNIGDWMSVPAFAQLCTLIAKSAGPSGRGVMRYIHKDHGAPAALATAMVLDRARGDEIVRGDRYPFYNIVPFDLRPDTTSAR